MIRGHVELGGRLLAIDDVTITRGGFDIVARGPGPAPDGAASGYAVFTPEGIEAFRSTSDDPTRITWEAVPPGGDLVFHVHLDVDLVSPVSTGATS